MPYHSLNKSVAMEKESSRSFSQNFAIQTFLGQCNLIQTLYFLLSHNSHIAVFEKALQSKCSILMLFLFQYCPPHF